MLRNLVLSYFPIGCSRDSNPNPGLARSNMGRTTHTIQVLLPDCLTIGHLTSEQFRQSFLTGNMFHNCFLGHILHHRLGIRITNVHMDKERLGAFCQHISSCTISNREINGLASILTRVAKANQPFFDTCDVILVLLLKVFEPPPVM